MTLARPLITAFAFIAVLPAIAFADEVAVIVTFHGAADGGVFAKHGGREGHDLSFIGAYAGRISAAKLRALRAEPGVASVEEDQVRNKCVVPNDPYYNYARPANSSDATYNEQSDDFGLINAPAAWDVSTGTGIRVAVLDTGIQFNNKTQKATHPDLGDYTVGGTVVPSKVVKWRNFAGSKPNNNVSDSDGHGTHTAGTVGAHTNNAVGVAGAGFNCQLVIVKVLGPAGGYDSWIANGINWAVDTGAAKVISMSLGGPGYNSGLKLAVDAAWGKGAVIVAAAGNGDAAGVGGQLKSYPAGYANCISVAACDSNGILASFSNYGDPEDISGGVDRASAVDIAAPGVKVLSTYPNNYVWMSGTSMATPHVAGVAALVWAKVGGINNADIRSRIERGNPARKVSTPAGPLNLLDAARALE